ncbi:unnamed protein product [Protopolystoma xenopodis]|uniref:RNA-binding protein 48 n=1 Tax=Protopolystoma xenopodis TaxID=117903 RepID=A0A448WLT1_9PLAT|nr:unnamed protein product [Protopolystoma xenopodis]
MSIPWHPIESSVAHAVRPPAYPYHLKVGACLTRPAYRDGKIKRAVKSFTIADESCYLILKGVPSLDLEKVLKEKLKKFGAVDSIRVLDDYPYTESFTQVFVVKMSSVLSARNAKRYLDETTFFGGVIYICYAPEYESVAECRIKLHMCRRQNGEHDFKKYISGSSQQQFPAEFSITSMDLTKDPSTHENQILPPELPCTSHALDALDDSREYWRRLGADYVKKLEPLAEGKSKSSPYYRPASNLIIPDLTNDSFGS